MQCEVVLNQEELAIRVKDYTNHFSYIIDAKRAEKYRVEYLFGIESQLWISVDTIIKLWEKIRICLGRYLYSEIYDKDKMEKSIIELKKIIEEEKNFIEVLSNLHIEA